MKVKIKYVRDILPLTSIEKGDWVDLRAGKDVFIQKGERAMIPLGVAMELPKGYEALVAPRSSTFNKYGIIMTNSLGIIDEKYNGDDDEWQFPAYCLEVHDTRYNKLLKEVEYGTLIKKNERICQFRILKHQPEFDVEVVEQLGNDNRGGFGSTGSM